MTSNAADWETQVDKAAGRSQASLAAARCRVKRRGKIAASAPDLKLNLIQTPTSPHLHAPLWPATAAHCTCHNDGHIDVLVSALASASNVALKHGPWRNARCQPGR